MTQPAGEVTREKLVQDFRTVITDTEELMKSAASISGDKAIAWVKEQNARTLKDLEARVKNFDRFAVILEQDGTDALVFKHAIATIRTPRSVPNYFSSHHP